MRMLGLTCVVMGTLLVGTFWSETAKAVAIPQPDGPISVLEPTVESATVEEYFGRKTAQLLSQPVILKIGEYQPIGDMTPSVVRGEHIISLFTSGFNGAPAPSAVIDGTSIRMDLSSLYLSHEWVDEFRIWNIGGHATGTIDLETLEFFVNWDRRFTGKRMDQIVSFSLRGTLVHGGPTPIPIGDTAMFLTTGLAALLIVWHLKNMEVMVDRCRLFRI
ncbi:MAG: hypothetical protein NNA20_10490 [Nitrospira sp.]|nr:hypothetical protein [Nitrospira sp.]MCP9443014.1 hypothetical protein [Nitrospira sp.]